MCLSKVNDWYRVIGRKILFINLRIFLQYSTEIFVKYLKKILYPPLPYAGTKGELIDREINATLKYMFKDKIVTNVAYKTKKLSSCFNIKDKSPLIHQQNLVFKCADCSSTYIGETARRLEERVLSHNKRDKNSSDVLKHSRERNHCDITINDIKVLSKNFKTKVKNERLARLFLLDHKNPL